MRNHPVGWVCLVWHQGDAGAGLHGATARAAETHAQPGGRRRLPCAPSSGVGAPGESYCSPSRSWLPRFSLGSVLRWCGPGPDRGGWEEKLETWLGPPVLAACEHLVPLRRLALLRPWARRWCEAPFVAHLKAAVEGCLVRDESAKPWKPLLAAVAAAKIARSRGAPVQKAAYASLMTSTMEACLPSFVEATSRAILTAAQCPHSAAKCCAKASSACPRMGRSLPSDV